MAGVDSDIEIEHRFFIPDSASLPGLINGVVITQCYLPRQKLRLSGGSVYFEDQKLVESITNAQVDQITKLMDPENYQVDSFRIRIIAKKFAFVTIKGPGNLERFEGEWEILLTDKIDRMVNSGKYQSVTKTRFEWKGPGGNIWEIDKFQGENSGLWLAELEVDSTEHQFDKPEWLGKDVTNEKRLGNGWLAKKESWADLKKDLVFMRWLMGPN